MRPRKSVRCTIDCDRQSQGLSGLCAGAVRHGSPRSRPLRGRCSTLTGQSPGTAEYPLSSGKPTLTTRGRGRGTGIESGGGDASRESARDDPAVSRPLPLGQAARAHLPSPSSPRRCPCAPSWSPSANPPPIAPARGPPHWDEEATENAIDAKACAAGDSYAQPGPEYAQRPAGVLVKRRREAADPAIAAFRKHAHGQPENPSPTPRASRFRPPGRPPLLTRGLRWDLTVLLGEVILRRRRLDFLSLLEMASHPESRGTESDNTTFYPLRPPSPAAVFGLPLTHSQRKPISPFSLRRAPGTGCQRLPQIQ